MYKKYKRGDFKKVKKRESLCVYSSPFPFILSKGRLASDTMTE
jgi:hypothetical protein